MHLILQRNLIIFIIQEARKNAIANAEYAKKVYKVLVFSVLRPKVCGFLRRLLDLPAKNWYTDLRLPSIDKGRHAFQR
ncbi:MAG: hypothetical protein EGQ82_03135 [Clostridiales bacterium]|nr:hypothetical protein [Clostridiales bacterium]